MRRWLICGSDAIENPKFNDTSSDNSLAYPSQVSPGCVVLDFSLCSWREFEAFVMFGPQKTYRKIPAKLLLSRRAHAASRDAGR